MAVSREHILSEIRRTAEENNGVALGRGRFATETGIREADWSGRYWARWSDAVEEAGLRPNDFQGRADDVEAVRLLALETRRLGHFPTMAELTLRRQTDRRLPSKGVYERIGRRAVLVQRVADYCRENDDLADVLEIVLPLTEQEPETADNDHPSDTTEFGSVYLLKSGRHYKLGRSNAFGRREREIALQLPERATTVHVIATDDPVGIEDYWHKRFADRRRNGEWFELSRTDVQAFKRRKFM